MESKSVGVAGTSRQVIEPPSGKLGGRPGLAVMLYMVLRGLIAVEYHRSSTGCRQWYRCTGGKYTAELETFSGRTIDVPACFMAGKSDWAVYYTPGALERMQTTACTQWRGTHLVKGAGHWVGEEQPEEVGRLLLKFVTDSEPP